MPDNLIIVDKGNLCLSDSLGRLAIVDLKKASNSKVIGELSNIDKRLINMAATPYRAYAITVQESAQTDTAYRLTSISISPADEPSVISQMPLSLFSEPQLIAAATEAVVVTGTGQKGENLVAVFAPSRKSQTSSEPVLLSTFTTELPVTCIDLQLKSLLLLQAGNSSKLDVYNLQNPSYPTLRKAIKLDGHYQHLSRYQNAIIVAGKENNKNNFEAVSITLDISPHTVAHAPLVNMTALLDVNAQKGSFFVLGGNDNQTLVQQITYDKALEMTLSQLVTIPGLKSGEANKAKLVVKDRSAYIATGWAGVDVLTWNKGLWSHSFTYSIPRLPASSVANWGDFVLLSAADLKLYNISRPERPELISTVKPENSLKAMVGAGSYALCLSRDELVLRRLINPNEIAASLKIRGQNIAFDTVQQRCFITDSSSGKTIIRPIKVYSNNLVEESSFVDDAIYKRCIANGGYVLMSGLHDLALWGVSEKPEQLGYAKLEKYAFRDIAITDELCLVTAVDQQSRGFLLLLSKEKKDLAPVNIMPLEHDGIALAVSGNKVVTIGRSKSGSDLASIVNIQSVVTPKVVATIPAIEAASAVTLKDNLAIIVGRGIQTVSLS
jgi:hypothetical protein